MTLLSIVIPTFNRAQILENFLNHLVSICPKTVEILVLDNASTDNTSEKMKQFNNLSNVRYIRHVKNLGFGRNVYLGTLSASSSNILYMGDDDKLEKNYLNEILKIIENNPDFGVITFEESKTEEIKLFPRGNDAISNVYMRSGVLPGLVINRQYMDLANVKIDSTIYPQIALALQACAKSTLFLVKSLEKIVRIDHFSNFNVLDKGSFRPADYGVFERLDYINEQFKLGVVTNQTHKNAVDTLLNWTSTIWKLKQEIDSQNALIFFKTLTRNSQVNRNLTFIKNFLIRAVLKSKLTFLEKIKYILVYTKNYFLSF